MAKIIEFEGSPVHRLKREVEAKNNEIDLLKTQLRITTQRLASVISVNEMLKLQLSDIQTNLQYLKFQIINSENNITTMKSKLPDLSGLEAAIMSIDLKRKFDAQEELRLSEITPGMNFDIDEGPEKPVFNPEIPPKS